MRPSAKGTLPGESSDDTNVLRLKRAGVSALSVRQLKEHLRSRDITPSGTNKSDLQADLREALDPSSDTSGDDSDNTTSASVDSGPKFTWAVFLDLTYKGMASKCTLKMGAWGFCRAAGIGTVRLARAWMSGLSTAHYAEFFTSGSGIIHAC